MVCKGLTLVKENNPTIYDGDRKHIDFYMNWWEADSTTSFYEVKDGKCLNSRLFS